ncbi:glycosyltransferase [Paenibacillus athensensis]|uniref:Glycosyl transferase family 1 n=1 Tax=Paenibacillus athensensis TaxID=1967502 RepID=A0A4Y8PQR2_9BACL|nr:glycosyltransferase [Paenibacillus athensensis]MCD1258094.1 glycosyltransferase [Paenibacillus athensensis]
MNVLFVYYLPSGGVETLNRQRCLALRRQGVQGHCLYYRSGAGLQNASDIPIFITSQEQDMSVILQNGRYDAVIVISDYYALQRIRAAGYTGKLIFEIQGFGAKATARKELLTAQIYISSYADALLHPQTPHIGELLAELYPAVPTFAFPNSFDTAAFGYRALETPAYPIMAWIGRLEDNKNWREALQIATKLTRRFSAMQLWMFIDPLLSADSEKAAFTEQIERLGLGPHLQVFHNVKHADMMNFLSVVGDSGGFLCVTSKVEGAPYAVLEAMSCLCPVLTTDSDGVRSAIDHNRTGKYYALGDIDHAAAEAQELMLNAQLRQAIRQQALGHVQVVHHPDVYAYHFINMIHAL